MVNAKQDRARGLFHIKLGTKILVAFFVVGLIPLFFLAFSGYNSVSQRMDQLAADTSKADFEQILRTTMTDADGLLDRLSRDPQIVSALQENDLEKAKAVMIREFQGRKLVVLELGSAQGKVLFRAHNPGRSGDDKSADPLVRKALEGQVRLNEVASGKSGFHIRSIAPVKSGGALMGTLQVGVDFGDLSSALQKYSSIRFAAVNASDNNVIYSSIPSFRQVTPKIAQVLSSLPGTKTEEILITGKNDLVQTPDGTLYNQVVLPFYDSAGKPTAAMVIFFSNKPIVAATNSFRLLSGLIAGIAFILVVILSLFISRSLIGPITQISSLTREISQGNYTRRVQVKTGDEIEVMADDLNRMLDRVLAFSQTEEEFRSLQQNLKDLLTIASRYADGDLTLKARVTPDQLGVLGDSFNIMAEGLKALIYQVKAAGDQVRVQTKGMEELLLSLSRMAKEEMEEISRTRENITSLAQNAGQMAQSVKEVEKVAISEAERARTSADAMNETTRSMDRIRENIQETSKKIKRLGEDSLRIGEILESMNEMTRKTNLLAINAAIEANAAGEAGRSFAIVAQEIKKLSDSSGQLTSQIETLVGEMISSTKEVGASMEESINEVVGGSRLTQKTSAMLKETVKEFVNNARIIQEIARGATQQSQVSQDISGVMERLNVSTQQTTTSMEKAIKSIEELSTLAQSLESALKNFKVA